MYEITSLLANKLNYFILIILFCTDERKILENNSIIVCGRITQRSDTIEKQINFI